MKIIRSVDLVVDILNHDAAVVTAEVGGRQVASDAMSVGLGSDTFLSSVGFTIKQLLSEAEVVV